MAKKTKPVDEMQANHTLAVERAEGETGAQAMARKLLEPHLRHAVSAELFAGKVLGKDFEGPGLMDYVGHLEGLTAKAQAGDLAIASRLLAAQAITLDSMFTELARRAAHNMGEYINAAESYARLALKAQSNCRATLDALAKLHQPREQTVKHVHVNTGAQAVVADQFHHHTGGRENAKSDKQSDATSPAGAGAALPCPNPLGNGVPIPIRERPEALQDARRHKFGGTVR